MCVYQLDDNIEPLQYKQREMRILQKMQNFVINKFRWIAIIIRCEDKRLIVVCCIIIIQINETFHELEMVYRDCIKRTRDKTRINSILHDAPGA